MDFKTGDIVRITTYENEIKEYKVWSVGKTTIYYRDDHTQVRLLPAELEHYDHSKKIIFHVETLATHKRIKSVELVTSNN